MTPPTSAQRKTWMQQWRSAEVALARVRAAEFATADLHRVALDLEDACVASALAGRDSRYSGLIEQQRLFHNRQRP